MGTALEPMIDGAPVKIITASNRMFAKAIVALLTVDHLPLFSRGSSLMLKQMQFHATGEYFDDLHGTPTTEMYRPSLTEGSRKASRIPFQLNAQYARNVCMSKQCCECIKPKLCMQELLSDVLHSCGNLALNQKL